jgi:Rab-GTPase-TBC domain
LKPLEEAYEVDKEMNKEPIVDIIEMDLIRSISFYDKVNHDRVKVILLNAALEYPINGYYQGMHYIGIYLQDFFKDDTKAFHMLCYIAETYLIGNFSMESGGFLRLVWMNDHLMKIHSPSLWATLDKNEVSSVHFATANICTLLTCLIKSKETWGLVPFIWDLMLARGINYIYDVLVYILDVQKAHIDQITMDQLLPAMQNVDSDPFSVLRSAGIKDNSLEKCLGHLTKQNLEKIYYGKSTFDSLDRMYQRHIKDLQNIIP